MSAISQKSISGITSITTPAGIDDQLTLHTSDTSQAAKLDGAGNFHFSNHVNTTGITSASNFKTGSSNLHSTGLTVGDTFVHSTGVNASSMDVDDFVDVGNNIKLGNAGVITATSFVGDGSDLTNLPAGLGTALSATASSPLNKMYYTNQVLGVPGTVTVDVPASASKAYTQYADIKVESTADLIIAEGDDLIPDVLGLADFGTFGGGASAGRIRVNSISNAANDGSPTVQKGLVVTGVTTSTTFSGSGASLTNLNASNIASGTVPTARLGSGTANSSTFLRGDSTFATVTSTTINSNTNNYLITGTGTANTLQGEANLTFDGDNLTITGSNHVTQVLKAGGATSDLHIDFKDSSNNLEARIFCASDQGDLRFYTGGANERLRINSGGHVNIGGDYSQTSVAAQITGDLLVQKTASAYLNPNIDIYNYVNGGYAGSITFSGKIGGSKYSQARIRAYGGSNTSDGALAIETGNMNEKLRIDSSGNLMINRTSSAKRFSVREGSSSSGVYYNAHIGGASHLAGYAVGIGFDPEGYSARTKIGIVAEGTSTGYSRGKLHFLLDSANDSGEATLSESRMTITDAGTVNMPSQPSFAAYAAQNGYTISSTFPFNATRHNIGSHFNTGNYRFTAPVAGKYLFTFTSIMSTQITNGYYSIRVNGSGGKGQYVHITKTNSGWDYCANSWIFNLNANDYVTMYSDSSLNWHGNDWQLFCGELLS